MFEWYKQIIIVELTLSVKYCSRISQIKHKLGWHLQTNTLIVSLTWAKL